MKAKFLLLLPATLVLLTFCTQVEQEEPVPTPGPAISQEWLNHYEAVQEALADDNFEGAKTAIADLRDQSEGEIGRMVSKAAEAGDIATMRTDFKPFSERIKDAELPEGHVVVYCPMAFDDTGAHWVQKDGKVMNPYFGAEMLHCGAVIKRGGATSVSNQ